MNETPSTANRQRSDQLKQETRKSQDGAHAVGTRASQAGHSPNEQHDLWSFQINEANTHDRRFVRNKIRTTKYTWLTFIPKNLFE